MTTRRWLAALVLIATPACSSATGSPDPSESTNRSADRVSQVASAYCSIQVSGKGARDTELDYLPHVIACENGGADLQALKAQAIAARSVAYYNMATSGSICDGQGCQVYSCGAQPGPIHYQAVAETAQQYLSYGTMLTYGFYVAGDSAVSGPGCVDGASSTTKWVTYNDGKSGTSVAQSKLGYVGPPGFGQNRGCMSQWGARCLEQSGRDYAGILRFYYGDDIGITTAPGSCSVPNAGSEPSGQPSGSEQSGSGGSAGAGGSGGAGGSEPPPPSAASCQGYCGTTGAVPGSSPSCYCDSACEGYGDCCGDFGSACKSAPAPAPEPPPSSGGSCAGSCGSSSPVPGSSPACYCDDSCLSFGDCCDDFLSQC